MSQPLPMNLAPARNLIPGPRLALALSLGAAIALTPLASAEPGAPAVAGPTTIPARAVLAVSPGADGAAAAAPEPTVTRVTPGRDPASAAPAGNSKVELGRVFESLSGGIALRPPAHYKAIRDVGKNEIVRFVPDIQPGEPGYEAIKAEEPLPPELRRYIIVSRRSFPQPQALSTYTDEKGRRQPGHVQNTLAALQKEFPGAKALRDGDATNLGNYDAGVIILRYTKNNERRLSQDAIIQANDQLFYIVSMNTPARDTDPPNGDESHEDPGERLAVDQFRAVLDSVVLLDREKIYDDQVRRLISTRSLLTNLTERKVSAAILPEQWMRVKKEGRDIGYSYMVQEPDRKANRDGVFVGTRSRLAEGGLERPFPRLDSVSNMYVSMDRRQEDWSKLTAFDDGKPHTAERPWTKLTEFGWSDLRTTRQAVAPRDNEGQLLDPKQEYDKGELGDANQPWVNEKDQYTLSAQYFGSKGDLDPVHRPLPPFYLPQALGEMIPRLLPPNEQKGYMFATYVSEAREVMLRYMDVQKEKMVTLDGRQFRAVPITDRLGQEGSVTTHYVSTDGHYLGSYNADTKVAVMPTDAATLANIWSDANLSKPMRILQDGGAEGEQRVTPNPTTPRRAAPARPTTPRLPPAQPPRTPEVDGIR